MDILSLILTCAPAVDLNTMQALIAVESSFNPYAIAIVKDKPLPSQPRDLQAATKIIEELENKGANFSVGLAQINKVNFERFGVTGHDLLDPCVNLQVSEKILSECYDSSPNQKVGEALSCYYSGNFRYGYVKEGRTAYVERVINNLNTKSLAVPSIKPEIPHVNKRVAEVNARRSAKAYKPVLAQAEPKLIKNFRSAKSTENNSLIFK